jgi:hypothetical protein
VRGVLLGVLTIESGKVVTRDLRICRGWLMCSPLLDVVNLDTLTNVGGLGVDTN